MLDVDAARTQRAKVAVAVVFALNGLALASWLARVPAVRDELGLSTAELGLLLLCLSAGSVTAIVLSGAVVTRLGPRRSVRAGAVAVGVGLLGLALALSLGSTMLAGIFLFTFGAGSAPWDVAMNVEGADVERRLGRSIMPRFHAGFSLGTVAGAGIGAATAALAVPVGAQLAVTALAVVGVAAVAVRAFLPPQPLAADTPRARTRDAWRERRTVLIGLFVLAFALTEGVAGDWLALALVDGHDTTGALGAVGYGVFVAAMTVGRLTGVALLARFGRVTTLRASAGVAVTGLLLVVFGGPLVVVFLGAVLWGAGAALGFPVGMSAAADDPPRAASRVAVVGSIGYTAFLAGPPLVGILAQASGILHALLVLVVALAVGFALAGSTRELTPTQAGNA